MSRARLTLLLALLATGGCGGPEPSPPALAAPTPPTSPDVSVLEPGELKQLLEGLRGKVVLVNVWASWAAPSRAEFPDLDVFAREYRDRNVQVLAISVDAPESRDSAAVPFVNQRRPGFRVVVRAAGPEQAFRDLLDPTWDGAIPTSFIFDREGRLRTRMIGPKQRGDFEQAVAPLVGSPRPRVK